MLLQTTSVKCCKLHSTPRQTEVGFGVQPRFYGYSHLLAKVKLATWLAKEKKRKTKQNNNNNDTDDTSRHHNVQEMIHQWNLLSDKFDPQSEITPIFGMKEDSHVSEMNDQCQF